jgi:hypothetical protein
MPRSALVLLAAALVVGCASPTAFAPAPIAAAADSSRDEVCAVIRSREVELSLRRIELAGRGWTDDHPALRALDAQIAAAEDLRLHGPFDPLVTPRLLDERLSLVELTHVKRFTEEHPEVRVVRAKIAYLLDLAATRAAGAGSDTVDARTMPLMLRRIELTLGRGYTAEHPDVRVVDGLLEAARCL